MKRMIALLFLLLMLSFVVACDNKNDTSTEATTVATTETAETQQDTTIPSIDILAEEPSPYSNDLPETTNPMEAKEHDSNENSGSDIESESTNTTTPPSEATKPTESTSSVTGSASDGSWGGGEV